MLDFAIFAATPLLAAEEPAGPPVLTGWTVSSLYPPYSGTTLSYAVLADGDSTTGFGSAGGGGDTVTVDFGGSKTVVGVTVHHGYIAAWGNPSSYPLTVQVEYWNGAAWVAWTSYAQQSGGGALPVSPATTSKIRLIGAGAYFGLAGLTIYGA